MLQQDGTLSEQLQERVFLSKLISERMEAACQDYSRYERGSCNEMITSHSSMLSVSEVLSTSWSWFRWEQIADQAARLFCVTPFWYQNAARLLLH
ncbi:MAG: hypothetical protein FRX49_10617 [Trebouxia sp. A1-2]|nr:MAG: hypothetical protein FRX49_10617 [Trebouxia sp. A1-2]